MKKQLEKKKINKKKSLLFNGESRKITKFEQYLKNKSKFDSLKFKSKIELSKIMDSLNKSLNSSQSILKLNPLSSSRKKYKFPDNLMEKVKENEYYKKWNFSFSNKEKKINNKSNVQKNKNKYTDFVNKIKRHSIIINDNKIDFLKGLSNFCPPHKSKSAEDITKRSILANCGNNKLLRYEILLNEKIGDFIKTAEKYPNFYDYDKVIQKEIIDEKIGLSLPGNFMNFNKDTKNFISIKVFHPPFVKERISKFVPVPEQTLLPKPNGNVKHYSKITMKQLYPD